ncbi:MAG TPA: hypothetical protein PKD27_06375 [Tepidiformaceae bacterium]|nr:hypothetical protein [Tepidiformaceae bacterium]
MSSIYFDEDSQDDLCIELQAEWGRAGREHFGIVIRSQEHPPQETVRRLVNLLSAVPEPALRSGVFYLSNYA